MAAQEEIFHHTDVLGAPQGTYQSTHWQAFYLIACLGNTCHLHATFGSHKEYLGIGVLCLDGICYTHGWKDMASCATSADDDSRFVHALYLFFVISLLLAFSPYGLC